MKETTSVIAHSLLTDFDISLFLGGKHYRLYEKMGAHVIEVDGTTGTYFAVWAPAAASVSVIGNFNKWNPEAHELIRREDQSGIWEGFVPTAQRGDIYKYHIVSQYKGRKLEKADPFALYWQEPPDTASFIWDTYYEWKDKKWFKKRKEKNLESPISIYEIHLGSWKRKVDEKGKKVFLSYQEIAKILVPYLKEMGFTHVEFMPLMEHPFYGSWGYQISGYYAACSRYGTPQDLMYLIEQLHKNDIGVIFDWVPSHFPSDAHALGYFDGTHLYEHADPRKGYHPDWKSYIFNYGRNEVRSFLISNALFWLDRYHVDGLRVDAVASMLYLDYSRNHGEWIPNRFGGNENLESIQFLKEFNTAVKQYYPDVHTIAEESTAWPQVSRPVEDGGLGFDMKWMMGWMHDTLNYFGEQTIYRTYHHNIITFSMMYAFAENFVLPFSHDEVVHGKGSLLGKMPGDQWQSFANLRLMYAYMFTHPGAKMLFMGGELGQAKEWTHEGELDWHLLKNESNKGIVKLVKDLNALYRKEKALYQQQFKPEGFEWIDTNDRKNSVLVYRRKSKKEEVVIVANFTPNPHYNYKIGVPEAGTYQEIFNSDDKKYWGSGIKNDKPLETNAEYSHSLPDSLELTLPPLGLIVLKKVEA